MLGGAGYKLVHIQTQFILIAEHHIGRFKLKDITVNQCIDIIRINRWIVAK